MTTSLPSPKAWTTASPLLDVTSTGGPRSIVPQHVRAGIYLDFITLFQPAGADGRITCMELLIQRGADVNLANKAGLTGS